MMSAKSPPLHTGIIRLIAVAASLLVPPSSFGSTAWHSIAHSVELADVVVVGRIVAFESNRRVVLEFEAGGTPNLSGRDERSRRWLSEARLAVMEPLKVRFDTQTELALLSPGPIERSDEPGKSHVPFNDDRELQVGTEGIWFLENVGANDYRLIGSGIVPIDSLRHVKQCVLAISTRYQFVEPGFPTDTRTWVTRIDLENHKVAVAPNGAIFVAGNCRDRVPSSTGSWTNTGWFGYCITAIDAEGKAVWSRGERCSPQTSVADIVFDETGEITLAIMQNEPLAETSVPSDTSDAGSTVGGQVPERERGVRIERRDQFGKLLWYQEISDASDETRRAFWTISLAATKSGDVIVAGSFRDSVRLAGQTYKSKGDDDVLLAKLDRHGKVKWASTHGGSGNELCSVVAVSSRGQIAVGGSIRPPKAGRQIDDRTMLVMYSDRGIERWGVFDGLGNVHALAFTERGSIVAAVNIVDLEPNGRVTRTTSLQKWKDNGKSEWARPGGGTDIAIGPNGQIVTVGTIGQGRPVQLDVPPPAGERDIFVACYGPNGKLQWAARDGGLGAESGRTVAIAQDRLILTGFSDGMTYVAGNVLERSDRNYGTSFIANFPLRTTVRTRSR